jgi:hypothetical protein
MTDVEELLRRSLTHHVVDAPTGDRLPAKVRRRRRRGAIASSLATLIVLALAGTAVALDVASPSVHNDVLVLPPGQTLPPGPGRVVAFHGIDITVPASWGTNQSACGVPSANTVVLDGFGDGDDCPPQTYPSGVSEVRLNPTAAGDTAGGRQRERAGQGQIVSYRRSAYGHRTMRVVVPSAGVTVTIDAPGTATTRISDSIRSATASPEGCAMQNRTIGNTGGPNPATTSAHAGARRSLIPPGDSTIALCQYVQAWLVDSTAVTESAASKITVALNRAPRGPGINYGNSESCLYVPDGDGTELIATYQHGPPVTVNVVEGCGFIDATNGRRQAHLSSSTMRDITGPLHSDF